VETAYAAINTLRLDDLRPHLLRTHDGGRTSQEIVRGLPAGGIVNVVREDPVRRGPLFCGTEQAFVCSQFPVSAVLQSYTRRSYTFDSRVCPYLN